MSKGEPMVTVGFKFETYLKARLERQAKAQNVTVSAIVAQVMRDYLETQELLSVFDSKEELANALNQ